MNRIEFMTELASLLQDIPVEERKDAMQYYNDYFDDAGEEQEQQVIEELESPVKVAEKIKADMAGFRGGRDKAQYAGHQGADPAAGRTKAKPDRTAELPADASSGAQSQPKSDRTLKIILIIALIRSGASDSSSAGSRTSVSGAGIVISLFAVFLGLVIAAVVVVITGVALFISGLLCLVPDLAVGFALMGIGLILTVVGVAASVAAVKLCAVAIPGICRGNCVDLS